MALTVPAMIAAVGLAGIGAVGAVSYFKPRQRLQPLPLAPPTLARARIHLHRIDLVAYILAASGALTLIPEAVQAFAPELMFGTTLTGTALEHLDYLAFVFVSLSFGMGLTRRLLLIQLEKASLLPCP
ncbi:hypothetical protein [Bosea sp. (in: a-proteobacteria)]|jgi:hypothetical protein|uniref:hypothetical protein n=1 Tax=Bosea sp. (in: a-proteobacteria) TaxID=1871050 RepID=UPI003F7178AE